MLMLLAELEADEWVIRAPIEDRYTISEVQRLLGLGSPSAIHKLVERGELQGPRTIREGQCISHSSLVSLVHLRGPIARHEAARKQLVKRIGEVMNDEVRVRR